MKITETWLRKWIGPVPTTEVLFETLTMAGLEIESFTPVAGEFSGVVVAAVLEVLPHPEADRLKVCKVDIGAPDPLTIVCGANNVVVGMKTALAQIGAILPNGKIRPAKLRGIASAGMLCSAVELGISEEANGLLVLPSDAPVGQDIRDYMALNDSVIDLAITPNRGDCLSLLGLSKEIAALNENPAHLSDNFTAITPTHDNVFPITIEDYSACPRYVGRIIRNLNSDTVTPLWMQEQLRRVGMRSIHPVVDVLNFVMVELGQPMHAFDLETLSEGITVRFSQEHETLDLLDGQALQLKPDTLLIADRAGPLAIAGVMGGKASGVTAKTHNIFLESAFFSPQTIAHSARTYTLGSESSFRFERGVDPLLQIRAMERATALILEIAGGEAGPIVEIKKDDLIPQARTLILRLEKLNQVSGLSFSRHTVTDLLQRPGFNVREIPAGWEIQVPPRRFDITREIDLIEEVLRLYGYENIPAILDQGEKMPALIAGEAPAIKIISRLLCSRGYHEVITYSFVDQHRQAFFYPNETEIELMNPMTANMAVMRKTLWPGLLSTLVHNINRQQTRLRLFEIGKCFTSNEEGEVLETTVVGGLVTGEVQPLQWGEAPREADFFDAKGDIECLFSFLGKNEEITYTPMTFPGLHPGQTAAIMLNNKQIGIIGALHPKIMQDLDLNNKVIVYTFDLESLVPKLPSAKNISKFPFIRRDLSILLDSSIPANILQCTIKDLGGRLLQSVTIFDVYQGKGIAQGKKSMGLALIIQHPDKTLTDEEISTVMQRIFSGLEKRFGAELRG